MDHWSKQPWWERSPETPLGISITNDKLRRMYTGGYAWRMLADLECDHEWVQLTPHMLRCQGVCGGWLFAQEPESRQRRP